MNKVVTEHRHRFGFSYKAYGADKRFSSLSRAGGRYGHFAVVPGVVGMRSDFVAAHTFFPMSVYVRFPYVA